MSQFRDFNVHSGASVHVFAIWNVTIGNITGTLSDSEFITWDSGAGEGVIVEPPLGTTLTFYQEPQSTSFPAVGFTVTGVGGGTAEITGITTQNTAGRHINPPLFLTSPSQGAINVNDLFVVRSATGAFFVRKVTDIVREDYFKIDTGTGIGVNGVNVAGYIIRDFTPNKGLPLPSTGDAIIGQQIREAFTILDVEDPIGDWLTTHTYGSGYANLAGAAVRFRSEHGRVILDGVVEKDSACVVSETVITLPVGYRPAYDQRHYPASDPTGFGHTIEISEAGVLKILILGTTTTKQIQLNGFTFVADAA